MAWKSETTKMTASKASLPAKAAREPERWGDFLSPLLKSRRYNPLFFLLLLLLHPCYSDPYSPRGSQNHRITECSGLEGSPSPTPCRSRVTQSRLHRTASRRVLNVSREGDSTAPLGSLGQGSVTLRGKKFFLMFR